jgi:hypothetical protein
MPVTRTRFVAVAVALLVAVGAAASVGVAGDVSGPADGRAVLQRGNATPAGNLTANVTIRNQTVRVDADGNTTVVVASVTLPEGGFISVRDGIGATLGHTDYLEPGVHENVTVTVDERLEPGQFLSAVALRDSARGTVESNQEYDVVETGSEEDNPYWSGGERVDDAAYVTGVTNATDGAANATNGPPDATNDTTSPTGTDGG